MTWRTRLFILLRFPSPPWIELATMPLFKFSSSDMLNTTLVEPTGHPVYTILTRPHFIHARHTPESSIFDSKSLKSDSSHTSTQAIATRRTVLSSFATGKELASIGWIGLQPTDIVIGEEKLSVKELFGCMGALTSWATYFSVVSELRRRLRTV